MQEEKEKANDQQPVDHLSSDHSYKNDDIIISKPKSKFVTLTESEPTKKKCIPKYSKKHLSPDPHALLGTLITDYAIAPTTIKSPSS